MRIIHLVSALSLSAPAVAFAQPGTETPENPKAVDEQVAAPSNAFEISVATGYSQGVGPVGGGLLHLEDLSGAGGLVEVDLGYRINPTFSVGGYGTFALHRSGDRIVDSTDVFGATAGIQAIAHVRPERSIDPWVSLGTGWEGMWLSPVNGKDTSLQGLQLARLQLGVDYRISKDAAIAPVIGGSLSLFVSQDSPMTVGYTEISGKKVNFTGFAGIAGRFDVGGSR